MEEQNNKNEIRIYAKAVAEYLTNKSFPYIRTVQDIYNPKHINWIFQLTPELSEAMRRYPKETK